MDTADTDAPINGKAGRAWLVPEPHPGHMLIQVFAPKNGLSWFLVSVDLDPLRVVLRGVDPDHEPTEGVDLELLEDTLIEIEVAEGLHMEDFVQLPGELARAIVRDLVVPDPVFRVQWENAVTRILDVLRGRRDHQRTQATKGRAVAEAKLKRGRAKKRKRQRKKRGHK